MKDLVSESLGVGNTYCLTLERDERDRLVAEHPNASCPFDVLLVAGLSALGEQAVDRERAEENDVPTCAEDAPISTDVDVPADPVAVEILGRIVDGHLAGRLVAPACDEDGT